MITKLEALLGYYEELKSEGRQEFEMFKVFDFGLFSTRRLDEITKVKWDQIDGEGGRW